MALSYTTGRNFYGNLTLDTSSANLTLGDTQANEEYRLICGMRDWPFLHRARTMLTVTSEFAALPYDIDQVESVFVTVSSIRHTPKLITSREQWDVLNRNTFTSDIPQYAFAFNGQLGLWPRAATAGNTITVNGKVRVVDLNTADLTSSTISALTNASTAFTASGGLLTAHAGFWLRTTFSTAASKGDGVWYEISSVTNGTTGVLVRPYGGTTITGASAACAIAQLPLLPEAFHSLPWVAAAADYWDMNGNPVKAVALRARHKLGIETLIEQYANFVTDPVVDDGWDRDVLNPNLTISL